MFNCRIELTTYKNRCAICLAELPQSGGYCAPILDASSFGEIQVCHNLAPIEALQ
jgi:hypothetical protein